MIQYDTISAWSNCRWALYELIQTNKYIEKSPCPSVPSTAPHNRWASWRSWSRERARILLWLRRPSSKLQLRMMWNDVKAASSRTWCPSRGSHVGISSIPESQAIWNQNIPIQSKTVFLQFSLLHLATIPANFSKKQELKESKGSWPHSKAAQTSRNNPEVVMVVLFLLLLSLSLWHSLIRFASHCGDCLTD